MYNYFQMLQQGLSNQPEQLRPINPNQLRTSIEKGVSPKLELLFSHGGTADIFKATFPTGEVAACKESKNASFNQMLNNEAAVMQKISENGLENIAPKFYGMKNEGGRTRVYMELLDGYTDLTKLTGSENDLTQLETIKVWNTVTSYLKSAQAKGISHLDFGTSNIMVKRESGELKVKIIDWGMATATADDKDQLKGSRQYVELLNQSLASSALTLEDKESLRKLQKKDYIIPSQCWGDISRILETAEKRYIDTEFDSSLRLSSEEEEAVKALTLGSDKPMALLSKDFLKTIFVEKIKGKNKSNFVQLGESYRDVSPLAMLNTNERLETIGELAKAL